MVGGEMSRTMHPARSLPPHLHPARLQRESILTDIQCTENHHNIRRDTPVRSPEFASESVPQYSHLAPRPGPVGTRGRGRTPGPLVPHSPYPTTDTNPGGWPRSWGYGRGVHP